MNSRVGEISTSNEGYTMLLIKYNNSLDVIIEFQDKYKAKLKCRYSHFKDGSVKNPYHKSVFNKGYIGVGDYTKKTHKIIYSTWKNMLKRCYSKEFHNEEPTYKDCIVCEEWHNFQNFAKWYKENYYEIEGQKMCLDKDILFKGNKIYSPQTCMFVPKLINNLFTKSDNTRGEYPIGISYHKKYNNLQVRCSIINNSIYLGRFPIDKPFEAFTIYKNFKEKYIKQIADEYKDLIPTELYEAMYRYEVEIDD